MATLQSGSRFVHRDCGKEIRFDGYGTWFCSGCQGFWKQSTLDRFSEQDVNDRFEAAPSPSSWAGSLVYKIVDVQISAQERCSHTILASAVDDVLRQYPGSSVAKDLI